MEAITDTAPLEIAEQRVLGFTHVETGRILAEKWQLPMIVSDTIEYHMNPQDQPVHSELTTVVHTADLLCQKYGLGFGYELSDEHTQSPDADSELLLPVVSQGASFP